MRLSVLVVLGLDWQLEHVGLSVHANNVCISDLVWPVQQLIVGIMTFVQQGKGCIQGHLNSPGEHESTISVSSNEVVAVDVRHLEACALQFLHHLEEFRMLLFLPETMELDEQLSKFLQQGDVGFQQCWPFSTLNVHLHQQAAIWHVRKV